MIVRLTLAYDGTRFRGWAKNAGERTVEGVLWEALSRVLGEDLKLSVAGRTDAGVHARGQVASFVSEKLATVQGVLSTATHFMLKPYKENGVLMTREQNEERLAVTP